ncbi:SPOR domain-containing protein [Larkinella arboricola]
MKAYRDKIQLDNAVILVILMAFSGWMSSCAAIKKVTSGKTAAGSSTSSSADYNSYTYDLSATRPKYTASLPATTNTAPSAPPVRPATEPRRTMPLVEPMHINKKLDAVLDTISVRNHAIRYAQGYRIQIYVGNERTEVDRLKRFTYQNFPELNPYTTYRAPTYRLKVGDFMRRMDAERYLAQLRQQFPSATLLSDRIEIRKSLAVN